MKASQEYVGASGDVIVEGKAVNEMTITFTPATGLEPIRGTIRVYSAPNYSSLAESLYIHREDGFSCRSDLLGGTETVAEGGSNFFDLKYQFVVEDAAARSAAGWPKITLVCKKWWNPVWPRVVHGFRIKTLDRYGKVMDETDRQDAEPEADDDTIALDARSFKPFPVENADPKSLFKLGPSFKELGNKPVRIQEASSYALEIDLPVPLEYSATEPCYVKYTFPKELDVDASLIEPGAAEEPFQAGADGWIKRSNKPKLVPSMLTPQNGQPGFQRPVNWNYEGKDKWIIVEGC
jgi:hypothetical protein